MKKILTILLLFLFIFISGCIPVNVMESPIDVNIQDYTGEIQDYFLTMTLQETSLIIDADYEDTVIYPLTTTNCLVGDAVDIYDDRSYFQAIITAVTPTNITFTPSLDKKFLSNNSFVKCGEWNMAIDGSVQEKVFSITPPTNANWHIVSSVFYILDNKVMDDGLFGSQSALANGISLGVKDGYMKNLFLIYNNIGFYLRKYDTKYSTKAPSGQYGYVGKILYKENYGAVIMLDGKKRDSLILTVRDDLTSQNEFAVTIGGHITTD